MNPKIPKDLHKVLIYAHAEAKWNDLTPIARRDFISWAESAQQEKTRKSRIARIPSMLKAGKRRPCCYALVPMNLYKALAGTPKAKVVWKDLTPDERRDFVSWIDSQKEKEARRDRVEKAVLMLAAGERHPK